MEEWLSIKDMLILVFKVLYTQTHTHIIIEIARSQNTLFKINSAEITIFKIWLGREFWVLEILSCAKENDLNVLCHFMLQLTKQDIVENLQEIVKIGLHVVFTKL